MVTFSPQYNSSFSYTMDVNKRMQAQATQDAQNLDSAGDALRDIFVKDSKGFESAQVHLRRTHAHTTVNNSTLSFVNNIVSDLFIFQEMAAKFKNNVMAMRNDGLPTDPSFHQTTLDNLNNFAQKLNTIDNGFYAYGFDAGNVAVVNPATMATGLPAGSGATFDYLTTTLNSSLTFRASESCTYTLNGSTFHTVIEQFIRAQRMALSANVNGTRSTDPALLSAATLMDNALDGFATLQSLFANVAGMLDNTTESLKDESVSVEKTVQALGFPTPAEALRIKMQRDTLLKIQDSLFAAELRRSKDFITQLERI